MTDDAYEWFLANDPEAQGISAEEYRRRTGIERIASESADIKRHLPVNLADEVALHCAACADRAMIGRRTVG